MTAEARTGGPLLSARQARTDRGARPPLWRQVKAALTDVIEEQGLVEHDRLPSEAELCAHFRVSRTVIREALAQMVNEGLIYRQQGRGAFVRARREEQNFAGSTVGFSGELAEKNRTVTRRVLRQEVMRPTPRVARFLQIDAEEPVVAVDRVLSVEGVPRAIIRCSMPARIAPGLEALPLHNRSLYDTIAQSYGIRLTRAERWIEAVSLSPRDAELLEVEPGRAALLLESVGSGAAPEPVEYYTAHYLTDRSRLRLTVTGPG